MMPATTFEIHVAIDDDRLRSSLWQLDRKEILASFQASLDHWIAERRLEATHAP